MKISSGQLHMALRAAEGYCKNAEEIEQIIIGHSVGAAAAAVASGWIPGAGGVVATGIALGFTVSMYYRICSHSNIKVSKNILKAIASVAVAEIAAYLGVIIAAELALTFIPGLGSISASVLAGIINFAMVYIAGILFLKMMTSVFKAGKDINNMTEDELKSYMKNESTKDNISSAYKEAKTVYKTAKNDKSYQQNDIHPMD